LLIFPGFYEQPIIFARLFTPNQGHGGRNCAGTKKISAALLAKVTDIPRFTSPSRRRGPALTSVCAMVVPFLRRISESRRKRRAVRCLMPLE
jgi:hypothetical protein